MDSSEKNVVDLSENNGVDSSKNSGVDSSEKNGNGAEDALPPPPPVIPPDVVPLRAEPVPEQPVKKKPVRLPAARRGFGSKGQKIALLTNHFKVNVTSVEGHFYHYSVCTMNLS